MSGNGGAESGVAGSGAAARTRGGGGRMDEAWAEQAGTARDAGAAPLSTAGRTRVRQAMVLAAGLGTRMRPLTEGTAKPLLPLGRRALLDHALDRLAAHGVERVVVNAHWQADRVAAHLRARANGPRAELRREETLLDTGGAIAAALADGMLRDEPLFCVNGDSFWLDGPTPMLDRLEAAYDPEAVDGVLMVHRAFQVSSEIGFGDFALDEWGSLRRPGEHEIVPYVYAGVQLLAPGLFHARAGEAGEHAGRGGFLSGPFSANRIWDRAIAAGRLRAVVHDGLWFHLSTPEDLSQAETLLHASAVGESR